MLIQQKTVPDDATIVVIAGPTTDFFPPEIEALNAYVAKGGKVMVMLDPLLKAGADAAAARRSSSPTGASAPATTSCSMRAAWARCSAPTPRCRWRRSIRRIRSPRASASLTAYPMARSMAPIEGGSNSAHRAAAGEHQRSKAGRKPTSRRCRRAKARSNSTPTRATSRGRSRSAAAVSAPATVTPPQPGNASPGSPDRRPQAGNARRRGRRLGLRRRTWRSACPAIATSS